MAKQKRKVAPSETLVLIPRCLQNSNCEQKVIEDVENCKGCGNCSIADLVKLKEKYSYRLFVATGGSLARKIIKDTKPSLILAVACERELFSGIKEVKHVPIITIPNQRPHGPCKDTKVDLKALEQSFIFLDA
jgi:hypothetical protein